MSKRTDRILLKGERISVARTYFDRDDDLMPYSSFLPANYERIFGTVEFYYWNTKKARILWDIDGKHSEVPLGDLVKERNDTPKQVKSVLLLKCKIEVL